MIPISFGKCFGWIHPGRGRQGVILCGAHPYEQLSAQHAWRLLADDLAKQGYWVLRFDYPNAGDSLDESAGADLAGGWVASIAAAAEHLRERAGVDRLVLAGLRLGGLLAAQAALSMDRIVGLALLAPALSGRAYVRELSANAALTRRADLEEPRSDGFEIGGFVVDSALAEGLGRLDLTKLTGAPAREILLLTPTAQNSARAQTALAAQGARVEAGPFAGLSEFLQAPTFAKAPEDAFRRLGEWLGRIFPVDDRAQAEALAEDRSKTSTLVEGPPLVGEDFLEEAALFGPDRSLVGVLCRPARCAQLGPTTIFLNSGANPHTGWARMTVAQARALACAGWPSLRIDLTGLGDSRGAPGRLLYSLDSCADVSAAIDWLETRGLKESVVVGLCSGAHHAFHAAVSDPRIVGAVMVNVQRFVWRPGDSLEIAMRQSSRAASFYQREILKPRTWRRLLSGEVAIKPIAADLVARRLRGLAAKIPSVGKQNAGAKIARGFETLSSRGARMLAAFSEEDAGIDELSIYMGAGARRFRALPGASLAFIKKADHNLTPSQARADFLALLVDFLRDASAKPEGVSDRGGSGGLPRP